MKKLLYLAIVFIISISTSYALTGKVTLSPEAKDGGVIITNLEHYPISESKKKITEQRKNKYKSRTSIGASRDKRQNRLIS